MAWGRQLMATCEGWLREGEVATRLGLSDRAVRKLAESGRIKTKTIEGMERGKRYLESDVEEFREVQHRAVPLIDADGGINLVGHVADWSGHRFVDRLDACWVFLMSHGYLDRAWSEQLRERIGADIIQCGARGRFACAAPTAADLFGEK